MREDEKVGKVRFMRGRRSIKWRKSRIDVALPSVILRSRHSGARRVVILSYRRVALMDTNLILAGIAIGFPREFATA